MSEVRDEREDCEDCEDCASRYIYLLVHFYHAVETKTVTAYIFISVISSYSCNPIPILFICGSFNIIILA